MRIDARLKRLRLGASRHRLIGAALDKGQRSRGGASLLQPLPSTSRILNIPAAWSMLHAEVSGRTQSMGNANGDAPLTTHDEVTKI